MEQHIEATEHHVLTMVLYCDVQHQNIVNLLIKLLEDVQCSDNMLQKVTNQ